MRFFMVTVRDSAAEAHHAPLFFPAVGMAERWFRDECQAAEGTIAKHPEDYELILLGSFDATTAEVTIDTPRLLLRGLDCQRKLS